MVSLEDWDRVVAYAKEAREKTFRRYPINIWMDIDKQEITFKGWDSICNEWFFASTKDQNSYKDYQYMIHMCLDQVVAKCLHPRWRNKYNV